MPAKITSYTVFYKEVKGYSVVDFNCVVFEVLYCWTSIEDVLPCCMDS